MKVLIIEDDESKQSQIQSVVLQTLDGLEILLSKSYHSGLCSILKANPNVVLLDMTLPTYDIDINEDGGRPQHYAGRDILRQMDRRQVLIPVIVITQFDVFGKGTDALTRAQLDEQLKKEHPSNYMGTIYYNVASVAWKNELKQRLIGIVGR